MLTRGACGQPTATCAVNTGSRRLPQKPSRRKLRDAERLRQFKARKQSVSVFPFAAVDSVELIQLMGPSVSTRQELATFKAVNQVVYTPDGPAYQSVSKPSVNSAQSASFVNLSEELNRKAEEVSALTLSLIHI